MFVFILEMSNKVGLLEEMVVARGTPQGLAFAVSNVLMQIVWGIDLQITVFAFYGTRSTIWSKTEDKISLIVVAILEKFYTSKFRS